MRLRTGTTAIGALVVGVVFILLLPSEGRAAPILRTFADVYAGGSSGLAAITDRDVLSGATSASVLTSEATLSTSFGVASFTGTASARATFGTLGAGVSTTIDNYAAQNFTTWCSGSSGVTCSHDPVMATAVFIDTLTIGGGVGADALQLSFDVDGTRSLSYSSPGILGGPSAQGTLGVGPTLSDSFSWLSVGFGDGGTFRTKGIPFVYGTPFQVVVRLDAFISPYDINPVTGTYDLIGTADYLHTAALTGLRVFTDSTLTSEVSAFTVSSESGTAYRSVPEPSVLWLLALAATGASVRARRKA